MPGRMRASALSAAGSALAGVLLASCSAGPVPSPSSAASSAPATSSSAPATSSGSGSPSGSEPGSASPSADLTIVAGFYPLEYAARSVAGGQATIVNLTPPGAEAHDLELTPAQVAQIAEADLVLYVPGFQPAVDDAVSQLAPGAALDVTTGLQVIPGQPEQQADDHSGTADPHVWLDPLNVAAIGTAVAQRLAGIDPPGGPAYAANANDLDARMRALDEQWAAGTSACRSRDLVVSHLAFGYLALRYDFRQVGITGLTPESEPSPARMAEVAQFIRDNGVTTIYYETLVDPGVAETIATETGATTAVLDPIEGLVEGSTGDYVSAMEANLEAVRAGQGCS